MNPIRSIAALAVASLGVTGLAACASDPAVEEPLEATISFSSYSYGAQGAAGTGTQALLDRFAELHPEITVVPENVPTADVLVRAKTALAAGDPPDVVQLGYSKLAEALHTLPLASIQEIAGDEWADHVAGITPGPVAAGEWDGSVHALPYTVSVPTMFYNADLFRAAGLDPEAPPTTIEDVRDAAEAIAGTGANGVYFGIDDPGKSDYLTQSVIDSAGGAIVDADGTVTVDSDAAVEALEVLQALTLDGLQPAVAVEDALTAFGSGQLGMFVASTSVLGNLQAAAEGVFELRTAGFPAFGSGHPTHSGAALVVLAEDSEQQRAAWEFVKFLTSEEGYRIITEEIGYLPLRPSLVEGDLAPYLEANPLLLPTLAELETMSPYLAFPGEKANQATVLLQEEAIAPIVLRGADARETLSAAADRIRDLTGAE